MVGLTINIIIYFKSETNYETHMIAINNKSDKNIIYNHVRFHHSI